MANVVKRYDNFQAVCGELMGLEEGLKGSFELLNSLVNMA